MREKALTQQHAPLQWTLLVVVFFRLQVILIVRGRVWAAVWGFVKVWEAGDHTPGGRHPPYWKTVPGRGRGQRGGPTGGFAHQQGCWGCRRRRRGQTTLWIKLEEISVPGPWTWRAVLWWSCWTLPFRWTVLRRPTGQGFEWSREGLRPHFAWPRRQSIVARASLIAHALAFILWCLCWLREVIHTQDPQPLWDALRALTPTGNHRAHGDRASGVDAILQVGTGRVGR